MPPANPTNQELAFVNAMRLSGRQWLATLGVLLVVVGLTPALWKRAEPFQPGPDFRIPYALSRDYWLYERRLQLASPTQVVLLGDSVIWGEYVRPDGTLSHFLNEQFHQPGRFLNAGVNGLFPLAMEGLVRTAGGALKGRRVLVHANVLWLTSPKVDLQTDKEERFNHADLVPQFRPRIPAYKADASRRLSAWFGQNLEFFQWSSHLQIAYFDQKDIPAWTLMEGAGDPTTRPHARENPLRAITLRLPAEPVDDPERGPASARHRAWSATGQGSTRFDWVSSATSLQWAAFLRTLEQLRAQGNDVLVMLGPFNEHIMAEANRVGFVSLRADILARFTARQMKFVTPAALPSALYADASHPLTEGYRVLAEQLAADPVFQDWMGGLAGK